MNCRRFIFILILFGFKNVIGQQGSEDNISNLLKTVEVIPPPPNAASLGKYGGIDPNISTGILNKSIPIFNYSSSNINLPISLNYSTSGFKVDEIASCVGVSWSLNAGGVITRSIYGAVDEYSIRTIPSSTSFTREFADNFLKPVSLSNNAGGYDSEPDRFSFNFNGYSGEFILDSNLHPILLNHSGLKIEDFYDIANPEYDFKITSPEGMEYFFGGDSAREVTDKNIGGNCGHDLPGFFPVSYYLKKIVHPNNDSIIFKYSPISYDYKSAISQNIFHFLQAEYACLDPSYNQCPTLNNYISSCVTWLRTSGVLLNEIMSSAGGKVKFEYGGRRDIPNDRLLKEIHVYQPDGALLRTFSFEYLDNYTNRNSNSYNNIDSTFGFRHFLYKFSETSADQVLKKVYKFDYKDLAILPRRLAFSQDHYGYYNGKNNSSLLPLPTTLREQTWFPPATANRESDFNYSSNGLLSKITYPTGGNDSILYQPNTIYTNVPVYPPITGFNTTADSEELQNPSTNTSNTANISFGQETILYGSCDFYGSSEEEDPIHGKAIIYVYRGTSIIFQKTLLPGEIIQFNNVLDLEQGQQYYIKITVTGVKVRASASFNARVGNVTYEYINKEVGGVRVAKVISSNINTNKKNIQTFNYSFLNDPLKSSGVLIYEPIYSKIHKVLTHCAGSGGGQTFPDCGINVCTYEALFSNSQSNLSAFQSHPIFYRAVTESFGDNYENGGIEHQFNIVPDMNGNTLYGDNIIGGPLSNQSIRNGQELSSHTFKMNNGNIVSVKKIFSHYKNDPRYNTAYKGYVVNRKLSPYCEMDIPDPNERMCYDVSFYEIFTNWSYPDSIRTQTYDSNGQNYLEQVISTEYENFENAMPTQISSFGSDQKIKIIKNYYPGNLILTGQDEITRQQLISSHIISPVLKQEVYKGTTIIETGKTNFKQFLNGLLLPEGNYIQTGSNAEQKRIEFLSYNNKGKILEQRKANDVVHSYLWDGNSINVIAECVNAKSNEIFFDSFEEEGSWDGGVPYFSSSSILAYDNLKVHSGKYSGRIDKPTSGDYYTHSNKWLNIQLTSPTKFKYSGWVYSNGPTAEILFFMKRAGETGYFSYLDGITSSITNKWVYVEKEFLVPADVTQLNLRIDNNGGGSVWFDDIRLYPSDAQMTTYTYEPLVGITSQTDANNRTTYYEYDGFGRLSLVRDQDRNILKKICYNYAGQPEDCGMDVTPLWQSTGVTRCEPCPANNNYISNIQQHQEKDNNPYSTSYNTLRWVNDGASANCIPQADWQQINLYCEQNGTGQNTGNQIKVEQDKNPCSSTYNQTRNIITLNCSTCPKPASWQSTGNYRCVKDGGNNNTGAQEREEKDMESCSSTYNQLRWVSNGTNCATCPKPSSWQATGNYRCQKDASNINTGYQEREEKDMESCSSTYQQLRWVNNGYNPTACPVPCSPATCSGNDRKCVNGVCETGSWIVVSSVWQKVLIDGLYQWRYVCTRKYCFSDGTLSSYSEVSYQTSSCPVSPCFMEGV